MDFQTAFSFKQAISSTFLQLPVIARKIYTFATTIRPGVSSISNQVSKDVKAVGVAEKLNGENYVKVLKLKNSKLTPGDIAKHFDLKAHDITVENTTPIKFKLPTNNHRPPFPGISVGHYRVTTGTLGCFVKDEKGICYILSNNHVLANTNKGKYKDPVLQPGKLDGGKRKKDVIAELTYLIELDRKNPNSMDAALAKLTLDTPPMYLINQQNKITGSVDPLNKMRVEKYGRTTGHTKGRITVRSMDLKVDYGGGHEIGFQDQMQIKGYGGNMFCDGGDSGALVFQTDTLKAVGLLFAGDDDGTTYASPIK
ncbi:MAG: hypothetical protein EOO01_44210, partial [Chitinophagaceae bacterium]